MIPVNSLLLTHAISKCRKAVPYAFLAGTCILLLALSLVIMNFPFMNNEIAVVS